MLATPVGTDAHGTRSDAVLRRFSGPARRPAFWVVLTAAIAAVEIVVLTSILTAAEPVPGYRAIFRLVGGVFAACGVIGWRRRPDSHTGPLMVATGFGLLVEPVFVQFESPTIALFGDLLEDAWGIPAIALLLSFLSAGRLEGHPARLLVAATILQQVAELARHLFLEREGNFLLLYADPGVADAFGAIFILLSVFASLGTAVLIGVQYTRASRPHRRAMLPSVAGISCLILFAVANSASSEPLAWLAASSLLVVPAAFLAGLLRSRLARGGVADLFGEIRTMRGAQLQWRLAKAAGDQSLVVAYRHADEYADADGASVAVPPPAGRSFAPFDGGALVYDAALDEDPGLIEVIAAAAAIALEHGRFEAESRASRQRLVAAGDAERRRLERDLHDGAQQRLVSVAIQLRLIEADIRRDPAAAEARVTSASGELARSLEELRELARGIHPAVLEHGIGSALTSLAARSAVPTALSCDTGDLPRPVELALYFVACEALANVGKYAQATAASIRLTRAGDRVAIEIADDGIGGARAAPGSGLHGLQDRVEALAGHLRVTSPAGAGTVVSAELPAAVRARVESGAGCSLRRGLPPSGSDSGR
jgi:signal transduction histidine kinase